MNFEKLNVYKKSMVFINYAYKITKTFSKSEIFGITSQMRRASLSVALNIAEGIGRKHKKEKIQFFYISRGSAFECLPLLQVSFMQRYIDKESYFSARSNCLELSKMITGLISAIEGT